MSRRPDRADALFRAVALSFSAAMLVLSLLTAALTAAVNDRAAALEREIAALRTENEILLTRCVSSVDLETLERYALQELGMQPCRSEQIVFLNMK